MCPSLGAPDLLCIAAGRRGGGAAGRGGGGAAGRRCGRRGFRSICSPSSHVSHLVPGFDQRRVLEDDWEEGGGRNGETGYLASVATAECPLRFLLLVASPALRLRSHHPLPLLLQPRAGGRFLLLLVSGFLHKSQLTSLLPSPLGNQSLRSVPSVESGFC